MLAILAVLGVGLLTVAVTLGVRYGNMVIQAGRGALAAIQREGGLRPPALVVREPVAPEPVARTCDPDLSEGKALGPSPLRPASAPGSWVSDDDYPAAASREEQSGVTLFRLDIGTAGKPIGCTVLASSGFDLLDTRTCALLMARACFIPARDAAGNRIVAHYTSRFRWELP